MKTILFFTLLPLLACSQPKKNDWSKQNMDEYKNVVKKFYSILYNENSSNKMLSEVYWDSELDSDMIKKINPYFKELTSGLPIENIFKIIDKAEISDEGLQFAVYLKLSFSKNKIIYFELGSDIPTIIDKIWLSDGTLLGDKIRNESLVERLLLVGIISDKDRYTNVRESPSKDSKIIDKITNKEIFYYVPNSSREWWEISRKDDAKAIIGYIHKSRILKYFAMSNNMKMRIEKIRNSD